MKILLLGIFVAVAAAQPTNDYTIRVKIISTKAFKERNLQSEQGYGDFRDADHHESGFRFVAIGCSFAATVGQEAYAARWSQGNRSDLIIQTAVPGSPERHECILKITVEPLIYVLTDAGALTTKPLPNGDAHAPAK